MKTFVTAIIILCTITVLVFTNAYMTNVLSCELLDSLSLIEQNNTSAIDDFTSLWEERVPFFSLTLPKQYLDRVYEGIAMMESAINNKDTVNLRRGILTSRRALEDIRVTSCVNIDNIL